MDELWDCVVVGGGAAGLSAALALGRARRRTLVVDAGRQSNLPAHGIGGLLGHDGRSPAELYAIGRDELGAYPSVAVRSGIVVAARREGDGFVLETDGGDRERSRRVLLASGMEYRRPALPGVQELWGGTVFHCPFCHGWEVREQPLAALANGERGVHAALLLRGWSEDIVLLTDGPAELDTEGRERLTRAGIVVDERPIAGLRAAADGSLAAVCFADGSELARAGLLVSAPLHQRCDLARQLGAATADPSPAVADAVAVDAFCRTTAPGVFAAGDVSARMPQVASAVAAGALAGAAVVQSLLADDYGLPLPPGGPRLD